MAKCQFKTEYWRYKSQAMDVYKCTNEEETPDLHLCKFHDMNYLQDKSSRKEHEQKVRDELELFQLNSSEFSLLAYFDVTEFCDKVNFERAKFKEAFFAIFLESARFYLTDFVVADFGSSEFFTEANFNSTQFEQASFQFTKFEHVSFHSARFLGKANFNSTQFLGEAHFNYVLFEDGKKILFETSKLTIMSCDL